MATLYRSILASAVGLVLSSIAFAASDGTTGTTSTGSTDLSLSISNLVQITKIADLDFGSYNGKGNLQLDHDVCVWTNVGAGTYKIKAHGDGVSNAFTLTNGNGTLPYSVKWNNSTGPGNTVLVVDTFSSLLSGASTTSTSCGGGVNANVQVKFSESDLLASKSGTYTGVLTLIVSP